MPTDPSSIPGYFGHGNVGFICDSQFVAASLPNSISVGYDDFKETLVASGRLPALGDAPVSAWLVARLAKLSGRRFPFEFGEVCGSDGDEFGLRLISFTTEDAIRPTGKLTLIGGRDQISLRLTVSPPHSAAQVRDAFLAVLLEAPSELRRSCIVVVYTSLDDDQHWKHIPYALGWDGKDYIFHDSPEHAIAPEDFD